MENKKNYKQWNKNTKVQKRNEELQETITGFLIFTDRNKEKGAVKDALNILNDATEELYPTLLEDSKKEETKQETTTLNNIENELSQLKKNKKIFYNFNTNCNGVVFLKIAKEYSNKISAKEIISHLLEKVNKSKDLLSKYISKFLPIEVGFKAKLDNFHEEAKELIYKYFKKNENKKSWKFEMRVRNNNSISKSDFMDYVVNLIDKDSYYVDYKNPELTFLVEITNDLCCLSVLNKYYENKCYNFQSISKTDEERNKEREKLIEQQKKKEKEKEQIVNINDKNNIDETKKEPKKEIQSEGNNNKEESDDSNEEIDLI